MIHLHPRPESVGSIRQLHAPLCPWISRVGNIGNCQAFQSTVPCSPVKVSERKSCQVNSVMPNSRAGCREHTRSYHHSRITNT